MLPQYIEDVTSFVFVEDKPEPSDIICVPGSSHEEHVRLAGKLFLAGYAPWILPAGRFGYAETAFKVPGFDSEWAWMKQILINVGVPEQAILREDQSRFTWDNARKSRQVVDNTGLVIKQGIICCRPFHAQRCRLYYQTAFPETRWLVCPANEKGFNRDDWFRTASGRERILGEVRRLGDQVNEQVEELMRE